MDEYRVVLDLRYHSSHESYTAACNAAAEAVPGVFSDAVVGSGDGAIVFIATSVVDPRHFALVYRFLGSPSAGRAVAPQGR
jgi:hypothetical protein